MGSFGGERARVSESSWALRKSKRRLTVVGGGREDLGLLGGDDSVTGNELGHDTTSGLDTEGKGVDINEDNTTERLVTAEDTTLDGSTVSNSLIRVDSLRGLLATEIFLEELLDLRDTGRTTDEDNLFIEMLVK